MSRQRGLTSVHDVVCMAITGTHVKMPSLHKIIKIAQDQTGKGCLLICSSKINFKTFKN